MRCIYYNSIPQYLQCLYPSLGVAERFMKELRAVGFTIKRGSRGLKGNAYGWEVVGICVLKEEATSSVELNREAGYEQDTASVKW